MSDYPMPWLTCFEIRAQSKYIAASSDPSKQKFLFEYQIEIHNRDLRAWQLISRSWQVTDGNNRLQHIQGEGVLGQQPWIEAGKCYRYTSWSPLPTPSGSMEGFYVVTNRAGESFRIAIPYFALISPTGLH